MFRSITLLAALVAPATLAIAAPQAVAEREATGTFDVSVTPNGALSGPIGLVSLTKAYHGGLEASGAGQMLGSGAPGKGAAAYVALEQVTGTLDGRRGGFMLQHSGHMVGKESSMDAMIVPGSGSDGLNGIRGRLDIIISGGVHRYVLHYSLPG